MSYLSGELRQRRAAIAQDPRIAVVVRADRPAHAHLVEETRQRLHRVMFGRVLRVVRDVLDSGIGLGVLALQARDEHSAFAGRVDDQRRRPLGRNEREARVVEDVRVLEQHDAVEPARAQVLDQRVAARVVFPVLNLHRRLTPWYTASTLFPSGSKRYAP